MGQQYGVYPMAIGAWKQETREHAVAMFELPRDPKPAAEAGPGDPDLTRQVDEEYTRHTSMAAAARWCTCGQRV